MFDASQSYLTKVIIQLYLTQVIYILLTCVKYNWLCLMEFICVRYNCMVTFVRYLQHTQGIHTRSIMLTQVIHIHIRIVRAYLSKLCWSFKRKTSRTTTEETHFAKTTCTRPDEHEKKIPVSPWMKTCVSALAIRIVFHFFFL